MHQLTRALASRLEALCIHPSRHVGSPGVAAAADYIAAQFRAIGYTQVAQEPFDTTGWRFGGMQFLDLDAGASPVPGALPCFFSRSARVEGVPLWLDVDAIAHLTREQVAGRLCVVEFFSDASDIRGRNGVAEDLDRLGAAAAVFISDATYHTTCAASTKIQRSPLLKTLGTAVVAEEGAYYLARNRHHRFHLAIDADTFPHTSHNVVATRLGTGPCRAVFGAHHDAAPIGPAACDNASGVAALLELARLLKDECPEWTFDFASFDAEEYCAHGGYATGSEAFVNAHPDRKWRFFLNFDSIGMYFGQDVVHVGRPELLPAFDTPYGILPIKRGGDDKNFDRIGIPTLWFNTHSKFNDFHTPLDTIGTLDLDRIAAFVEDALSVTRQLTRGIQP